MSRKLLATRVILGLCLLGIVGASCLVAGCGSAGTASPTSAPAKSDTIEEAADHSSLCPFASPKAPAASCNSSHPKAATPLSGDGPKVGVLLVSHGSHSKGWRKMMLNVEQSVQGDILKSGRVGEVRSAFMEYTEPSIATQLKAFDRQGYTDIILVPLFLTVSAHSFDDIPSIIGQKQDRLTTDTLRLEGIEIYKPKARTCIAPLLDYPVALCKNVVRRVRQMSQDAAHEGVVLVAYGDEEYEKEWKQLVEKIGEHLKNELDVDCVQYAWCGHPVRFKSEPTAEAIRDVLKEKQRALVVPLLVGVDEMLQGKVIGGAIRNVGADERIAYRHDAILPDEYINRWVVDISLKLASKVMNQHATAPIE